MKKWKKMLAGLFVMAGALLCMPDCGLVVKATDDEDSIYYNMKLNDDETSVTITKYVGGDKKILSIPDTISEKK